jgi:hypothetical protein
MTLRNTAIIMKINPIMKIKDVFCSVRKRIKNSVPMVKQPAASSVEARPSKVSFCVNVVCMVKF